MVSGTDISFRPAEVEDSESVQDIVRAAYSRWIPVIGREPRPMVADYAKAVREHDIDIAYVAEVPVGVIETSARDDHLWIENVAVLPDHQGKGIGLALLTHAERKATQAGLGEIRLLTNEAFSANIALYERVGYAIGRREPFMGGTTVYMSKKLASVLGHC